MPHAATPEAESLPRVGATLAVARCLAIRSCFPGDRDAGSGSRKGSPYRRSAYRWAAGFTLLEILVVMAVVTIIIGLAVVRLDDGGQRVTQASAERLALALEAARDTAIYSGQPVAFSSDGEGYQFWRGDDRQNRWLPLSDDNHLRARRLQGEVRLLQQTVNRRPRPLGERLVFSPEGVSDPLTLLLQGGDARVEISTDALGRVAIANFVEDIHAQ